jgi:hypothetical protein
MIRCYTLFDTVNTGVTSRRPPVNGAPSEIAQWQLDRNRQVNYDTILQVVSLRAQPENMSSVVTTKINFRDFDNFGFLFEDEKDQLCYQFDFTINHKNVFYDGVTELGALYNDCIDVPMIKTGNEWEKLPSFLDISPELKNIHFEVVSYEEE